jgi:hypothetical protein
VMVEMVLWRRRVERGGALVGAERAGDAST